MRRGLKGFRVYTHCLEGAGRNAMRHGRLARGGGVESGAPA